ncbi:hypothetical protein [Leptothermofonsia sp. ETS-13]|uniref:hypothetical protein n=1 Tax=Leptothermofonsia sp. ETS-13 TaxID=3035696 RepID=UPI003B9E4A29
MAGLFAQSYDPEGARAGIAPDFEDWVGGRLAQALVHESLSATTPTSIRVECGAGSRSGHYGCDPAAGISEYSDGIGRDLFMFLCIAIATKLRTGCRGGTPG